MEKFKELGLEGEILKGIEDLGFEVPSPVQEKVIPVILGEENDLVALAQTGTGKTAGFRFALIAEAGHFIECNSGADSESYPRVVYADR